MFSNYYILILVGFVLPAISFIFSTKLGFVVTFILFLIYCTEKTRFQSEIDKSEKNACDSIEKCMFFLQSLNRNIMVRSTYTEELFTIYNENNSYMEKFGEEMQQVISSYEYLMTIKMVYEVYFLRTPKAYYIKQMYDMLYNFNIYEFHHKYKDIQNMPDFELYKKDWFNLYFYYRK